MANILLFLTLSFQGDPINYQTVENSAFYEFKINYWFNMHHFLKQEAFLQAELDSSLVIQKLPRIAHDQLEGATVYYKENLGDKDLRTDDYMSDFQVWVTEIDGEPETIPSQFKKHFEVLRSFSKTYQDYFWKEHELSCLAALDKYLPLIKKTEEAYWEQILDFTKAFIMDDTIKVDVVYLGKSSGWNTRNRPYTSIFPTRVVMNTVDFDEVEGEWLELLFHESAHALILSKTGFVAGTIIDVAESMDVKVPRQLGHAYLFYMTGYVAQELLQDEGINYALMYMKNKNVFSRYHVALKKLDAYMKQEQTLAAVTADILAELTKE